MRTAELQPVLLLGTQDEWSETIEWLRERGEDYPPILARVILALEYKLGADGYRRTHRFRIDATALKGAWTTDSPPKRRRWFPRLRRRSRA